MRIVREQMLCIVSEQWRAGVAAFKLGPLPARLDELFTDTGVIHFASIALLPPRPGAGAGAPCSLMLELAADEGIRPAVLLATLAHHPTGALATFYGAGLGLAPDLPVEQRNRLVLEHLLGGLSVADGGFVGPRDRTVSQVTGERTLYEKVRAQAVLVPAEMKAGRASFARALSNWTRGQPEPQALTESAPQSFWRAKGGGAKLTYFGAIVGAVFLAAWIASLAFGGLERLWEWAAALWDLPGWVRAPGHAVLHAATTASTWAVHVGFRLTKAAVAAGFALAAYALIHAALRKRLGPWNQWFDAVARELDRPTEARAATVTHAFMWLVVPPVFAVLGTGGAYVLAGMWPVRKVWTLLGSGRPVALDAVLFTYAALFFALSLVLVVGLRSSRSSLANDKDGILKRHLKDFRRWLHQPSEDDIPRAQQVHESIERCEARTVGGTAHLISLTELRRPYAWSAFWTRLSLRFVTAFGYVFFTEGRLGDAPGIQYSHWHIVDGGRRLLFCANFDGTFGGYLDDFIKGPSIGTTLFWRWTELVPRQAAVEGHPGIVRFRSFAPTRLLVFRGVKCELKFKTYARESMLPNIYRFDALDRTLEQKNRATRLRDALCGERTDAKDDLIMRTIES